MDRSQARYTLGRSPINHTANSVFMSIKVTILPIYLTIYGLVNDKKSFDIFDQALNNKDVPGKANR